MNSNLRCALCVAAWCGSVVLFPLPARAKAPALERSSFVSEVLAANPGVEAARQSVRAAVARVRQAGPLPEPMIDVGVAPLSIASKEARFGYEVSVSQELPWFGKRGLERDAASAEAAAARRDYEGARRDLALTAALLYDDYYVATRALEINGYHAALMRAMRDAASAQLEIGRGSAQDSLRAEAELAHLEHDSFVLASERDVIAAQMNELLHRAPEAPLPPPVATLVALPMPTLPEARLAQEARANRPEIAAAQQRARAEQARAERAQRDAYPGFTLSTSYNSMWDMPEHRWMVGVGFSLPLQLERRAGASDEANAMSAEYTSEAARASDRVATEAFVAARRVREAAHVLELFDQRLLPLARRQVDAARAAFTTSQTSFAELMAAEKSLRDAELERERALADVDRRQAELEHALGRVAGAENPGVSR